MKSDAGNNVCEQEGWDAVQFSLRWFLRADLAACDRLFGPRVLFPLLCSIITAVGLEKRQIFVME